MSQMTINVKESSMPVPDASDSGTIAPGTGTFTTPSVENGATVAVGVVSILLLVAVAIFVVLRRHYSIKLVAGRSRWLAKSLVLLAIVAAICSFSTMQTKYDNKEVKAADNGSSSLSISTEDITMELEVADKSVYGMVANKVTVNAATYAGYTLSAYVTNPDLVAAGGSDAIMNLDGDTPAKLNDKSWGIALARPDDQNSEVFLGLSADSGAPTLLKETHDVTLKGDENIFYYGAYVTPELSSGVYTGATINYVSVANFDPDAPVPSDQIGVIFEGEGLEFEGEKNQNRVNYKETCGSMHSGEPMIIKTSNIDDDGVQHGAYTGDDGYIWRDLRFDGVRWLEVEVKYDFTPNTGDIHMSKNGRDWFGYPVGDEEGLTTKYFNIYGDALKIDAYTSAGSVSPRDYGFYIKITPIYDERKDDTSEVERCFFAREAGDYEEPAHMTRYWINEDEDALYGGTGVENYLDENKDSLIGSVITVRAYNPDRIIYDGNNATAGTMNEFYSDWAPSNTSENIDLIAPNFYKNGYGFVGWSENAATTANDGSKIYGPNERVNKQDFTFDANTHEKKLYAVWVASEGTMQGFDGCSNMQIGQISALTDTRDGNTYAITRTEDGHCWMMENLRLNSENSADESLAQGFGGAFSGLAQSEDSGFTIFETVFNEKYTADNIVGDNQVYRIPRYNNENTRMGDANLVVTPGGSDDRGENWKDGTHRKWYSYGNYYNWPAAMANTDDYNMGNSEYAGTSICPKGWHLPAYNGRREFSIFGSLVQDWTRFPRNFVYSGDWGDTAAINRGTLGLYLSSSSVVNGNAGQYVMVNRGSDRIDVLPQGKVYTGSVRCLADY